MYPYYIARTLGGLLFLIGAVVGSYNIWMTARAAPLSRAEQDLPVTNNPATAPAE